MLIARRRKTTPSPQKRESALSGPKGAYGLTFTQSDDCDNELDTASGVFTFPRSSHPSLFIRIEEAARNYCTPNEAGLEREAPLSCLSILQFVIRIYLKFSMTSEVSANTRTWSVDWPKIFGGSTRLVFGCKAGRGARGGQQLQLACEHRRWIQSRTLEALFLGLYGGVQIQSKLPRIEGGYK